MHELLSVLRVLLHRRRVLHDVPQCSEIQNGIPLSGGVVPRGFPRGAEEVGLSCARLPQIE
ncbi:MAG TPA: hypothetical protein VFG07_07215 [Thermoplasmata archaeon]|nr:hypothetical protein [Thermoplasmata archaeon]